MAEETGNSLPEGDVQRVVSISTKSSKLDAIAAQVEGTTTEEKVEDKPVADEQNTTAPPDKTGEDKTSEVKETDQSKIKATGDDSKVKVEVEEEDDGVNLEDLYLDEYGKDTPVSDLLKERDLLRKTFDEIDKHPFLKDFIEHYLSNGNANAYLEARGVDWDKKEDVEVLRSKFERENSDLDPKIREKIWKRELADKYKMKSDLTQEEMESEDYEIAQGLLKRDANKARGEFKETQKKFTVAERKQEEKPQQQFDRDTYKRQVLAEKDVDSFMKSKLLKLGIKNESGQSFGFEPSKPDQIIEMMTDDREFLKTFYDFNSKKVDRIKQAKIYAYASNPDEFEQQLVDFGKTLGLEDRLKELKNTDDRLTRQTLEAQSNKGTFAKNFLAAALKQKPK